MKNVTKQNGLLMKMKRAMQSPPYNLKMMALVCGLIFFSIFSGGLLANKGDIAQTYKDTLGMIGSFTPKPTSIPIPTLIPIPTATTDDTYIYTTPIIQQFTATPIPIKTKVPVALPNGNVYQCDSNAQQAVRDAGNNLANAERDKANCYIKYGGENTDYSKTCIQTCSSAYGIDRPAEYDSCTKSCADYESQMKGINSDICNTYTQAQKESLDKLISMYCQ